MCAVFVIPLTKKLLLLLDFSEIWVIARVWLGEDLTKFWKVRIKSYH